MTHLRRSSVFFRRWPFFLFLGIILLEFLHILRIEQAFNIDAETRIVCRCDVPKEKTDSTTSLTTTNQFQERPKTTTRQDYSIQYQIPSSEGFSSETQEQCWCQGPSKCLMKCFNPVGEGGCIASNFSIDFQAMNRTAPENLLINDEKTEMFTWKTGFFYQASCIPTSQWGVVNDYTNHKIFRNFFDIRHFGQSHWENRCLESQDIDTIFVIRRDFANIWHQTAALFNVWMRVSADGPPSNVWNVIFLDMHEKTPLDFLWSSLYGPTTTMNDMAKRKTINCYRTAIFPPVVEEFKNLKVDSLQRRIQFQGFRNFVLNRLNLTQSVTLKKGISILFVWRRDYKAHVRMVGKIKRKIKNEVEVRQTLESIQLEEGNVTIDHIDFANSSLYKQIVSIYSSDVCISVSGAGLVQMIYMRPGSFVLELSGLPFAMFANLAKMSSLKHRKIMTDGLKQPFNPEWVTVNIRSLREKLVDAIREIRRKD